MADLGRPLDGVNFVVDGLYVQVTVVPLSAGGGAVLHFDATAGEATWHADGPFLRITTLGPLRLESGGVSLGGEWLDHRPGQLLKYLICARGKRVPVEELAETLWGNSERAGLTSLRQAVHGLRDRLEPERAKHAPSRFVLARANAYELDTRNIVVDADEFEREAVAVLRTAGAVDRRRAAGAARACRRHVPGRVPRRRAVCGMGARRALPAPRPRYTRAACARRDPSGPGTVSRRVRALQRIADLEPLDLDAQRDLISLLLRRRRHAEAAWQYELARRQFKRAFGQEPDFALADLVEPAAIAA